MSDHQKIQGMLSLAAAGALEQTEEDIMLNHLRDCETCAAEAETWRLLASGLRRLPTPQPRAIVVERARAQAQIRLFEEFERRWNQTVMMGLIFFAWVLTLVSWPVFRFATGGLIGLLDPNFHHLWITFALFTATVWATGGAAAVVLSVKSRGERRLA
jgi:anti-sigma factor RsiW